MFALFLCAMNAYDAFKPQYTQRLRESKLAGVSHHAAGPDCRSTIRVSSRGCQGLPLDTLLTTNYTKKVTLMKAVAASLGNIIALLLLRGNCLENPRWIKQRQVTRVRIS